MWKFSSAGETLQSKWVQVTNADVVNGSPLIRHNRRMLRFSATQLWENLIRQGWTQVPLQWLVNNPLGRPRLWHVWRSALIPNSRVCVMAAARPLRQGSVARSLQDVRGHAVEAVTFLVGRRSRRCRSTQGNVIVTRCGRRRSSSAGRVAEGGRQLALRGHTREPTRRAAACLKRGLQAELRYRLMPHARASVRCCRSSDRSCVSGWIPGPEHDGSKGDGEVLSRDAG